MAKVGKNIRLLRKEKNMTQDDLAERLYVSRQTVSNYENGKSNPDIDMLVKIAEILETDVNVLIFGVPVSPSRKKEYMKLLCGILVLLLLGLMLWRFIPMAEKWRMTMYDHGPMFSIQMLLLPAVYLTFGWTLMQSVSLIWRMKKQDRREMKIAYYTVAAFFVLYAILVVPFCMERLFVSSQLPGSTDHSLIPTFLPDFWSGAVICYWYYLPGFRFLFLPAGLVLWNRPEKRE